MEHIPYHPGGAPDDDLFERQAHRRQRHPRKLLEARRCRSRPAVRSSFRPTITRSTGGTSRSARSPADEANQILAKRASAGYKPIFNGQNLAAWAGPIENYEVKDGVLRCKPHEGGTIYYNKELTDFMARVEFKLPAGGNNGLAIRYPGKGDTAYDGMCELQILDDGRPQVRARSTLARRTARPMAWSPPQEDTCGRSASGTSRK